MAERGLGEQRREHRRAPSRDQLFDAAEQEFARNGFHDASLREIAELAEFSVGAVYSFFVGKEDICRAIFLRQAAEFMPEMQGSPVRKPRRCASCSTWPPGRSVSSAGTRNSAGWYYGKMRSPHRCPYPPRTRRSSRTSPRPSTRRPTCSAVASRQAACARGHPTCWPGCSLAWSAHSRRPASVLIRWDACASRTSRSTRGGVRRPLRVGPARRLGR
jgi:hypothetical protein